MRNHESVSFHCVLSQPLVSTQQLTDSTSSIVNNNHNSDDDNNNRDDDDPFTSDSRPFFDPECGLCRGKSEFQELTRSGQYDEALQMMEPLVRAAEASYDSSTRDGEDVTKLQPAVKLDLNGNVEGLTAAPSDEETHADSLLYDAVAEETTSAAHRTVDQNSYGSKRK